MTMSKDDWDFVFELLLRSPRQPEECRSLLEMLRTFPHDRSQRSIVADWLYENGYDRCAKLVREGYTPGGQCGPDLDAKPFDLGSGVVASGSIGLYQLASGAITGPHVTSGGYWSFATAPAPAPQIIASGTLSANYAAAPPSGSVYEELDD